MENVAEGTVFRFNIMCGRPQPKKGDGATSAILTPNQITQINAPGNPGIDLGETKATLDPESGIVTTDRGDASESWSNGTTKFVDISMTVTGSGTNSVTIVYTITFSLEGGAEKNPPGDVTSPYTVTIIYTAEEVEE